LREEEIPSGEDEREEPPTETGEEEASEASSRESRGAARLPFRDSWVNALFDILLCLNCVVVKSGEGRSTTETKLSRGSG
jgi:hypothetical protein